MATSQVWPVGRRCVAARGVLAGGVVRGARGLGRVSLCHWASRRSKRLALRKMRLHMTRFAMRARSRAARGAMAARRPVRMVRRWEARVVIQVMIYNVWMFVSRGFWQAANSGQATAVPQLMLRAPELRAPELRAPELRAPERYKMVVLVREIRLANGAPRLRRQRGATAPCGQVRSPSARSRFSMRRRKGCPSPG